MDQLWLVQTSLRLLELITGCSTNRHAASIRPLTELQDLASHDESFAQWMAARGFPLGALHRDRLLNSAAHAGSNAANSGSVGREPSAQPAAEADDVTFAGELWTRCLGELASLQEQHQSAESPLQSTDSSNARSLERRAMRLVGSIAAQTLRNEAPSALPAHDAKRAIAREIAYDMAYGLSHELNNPLANIATRGRLLAESERDAHKRGLLEAIVDQAMRGCEMIADLMTVAHPPILSAEDFDLVALVQQLQQRADCWTQVRGLALECQLPQVPVLLKGDPIAVGEALWALLRNAIEMAERTIEIQVSVADQALCTHPSIGPASHWVRVSILDDGPGLSEEALRRAFHPYFSGREAGRGLGLGLSKAERMAEQLGGYAMLKSRVAGGCEACWCVPLTLQT